LLFLDQIGRLFFPLYYILIVTFILSFLYRVIVVDPILDHKLLT
jgi:hypothetical protein